DVARMTEWLEASAPRARETLEAERAAAAAFKQRRTELDALFDAGAAPATVDASMTALCTLLAMRDSLDETRSEELDVVLNQLAREQPERLVQALLHPDLLVRVRSARALRAAEIHLDPWAPEATRQEA